VKRSETELRSSAKRKRWQDLGRTSLKMTRGRLCKVLDVTSYYGKTPPYARVFILLPKKLVSKQKRLRRRAVACCRRFTNKFRFLYLIISRRQQAAALQNEMTFPKPI